MRRDPGSIDTLRSESTPVDAALGVPCLTIVWHPDVARVGQRMLLTGLLAGIATRVGRNDGVFGDANTGDTLGDPHISRDAATLRQAPDRGVSVEPGKAVTHIDGLATGGAPVHVSAARLTQGVVLRCGSRTLLLLHNRIEARDVPIAQLAGDSDAIRTLRSATAVLAKTDDPVLILGETGTGKELVARALHAASARASGPFVAVNMATLSETMAPSELFGHVRGAFTGADRVHRGWFERASGGVLFLDEIGEAPRGVQPMLLRALETGRISPVGAEQERAVDVRIVAATDRKLFDGTEAQDFRAPLLHRLATHVIRTPSLGERRDDVGVLLARFMREALVEHAPETWSSDPNVVGQPWLRAAQVEDLLLVPCPGNVRQLRGLARRFALSLLYGPAPSGPASHASVNATLPPPQPDVQSSSSSTPPKKGAIGEAELLSAMERNDFVPERAARELGASSGTMHFLMQQHGIPRASDLTDADVKLALSAADGDTALAARTLRVSHRALSMLIKKRGL